jgi:hypothetical protein
VDKLIRVAREVGEHQKWFYDLVDAIGLRFCGISRDTLTSINFSKIFKDDQEELKRVHLDLMSNLVIDDGLISEILGMINNIEDDDDDDE